MVLPSLLGALARRWYIVLIGLVVTAGLGYATMTIIPSNYVARSLVLLLPSEQTVGTGNPLLSLSGLEQPANLVVAQLNSADAKAEFERLHPGASLEVSMDWSTRGPVIAIEATANSPAGAMEAQHYTAIAVGETLAQLQQQVAAPRESYIRAFPLTQDAVAEPVTSTLIRAMVAVIAVGLALTGLATAVADGLMRRRGSKSSRSAIPRRTSPTATPSLGEETQKGAAPRDVRLDPLVPATAGTGSEDEPGVTR